MWRYSSINSYPDIILHDCIVEQALYKDNNLTLLFDNCGFWVGKDHPDNPYGQILRTGQSEITFVNVDAVTVREFVDFRLLGRVVSRKVREIPFEQFISRLNSGKIRYEFVDEYYARWDAMFCGYQRSESRPYFKYTQIETSCDEIVYRWNEVYEDRTW